MSKVNRGSESDALVSSTRSRPNYSEPLITDDDGASTTSEPTIVDDRTYSSFVGYSFTINYILGVGILSVPYSFYAGGVVLGGVTMLLVTALSIITLMWLAETAARAEQYTQLQELGEKVALDEYPQPQLTMRKFEVNMLCKMFFGKLGRVGYDVAIGLYLYGALWSYTAVFVSSVTSIIPIYTKDIEQCDVYAEVFPPDCEKAYLIFTAIFVVIVVPLACLEPTEQVPVQVLLTLFRFLALGIMIITTLHGMYYHPYHDPDEQPPFPGDKGNAPYYGNDVVTWRWKGLNNIVAAAIFAQLTHHSAPGLMKPLKDKTKIKTVFGAAMLTTCSLYTILGVTAATYYGDKTKPVVSLNWANYQGVDIHSGRRPFWAELVHYIVVLFPPLDIVSAYPLTAITLAENLKLMGNRFVPRFGQRKVTLAFRVLAAIPPIIGGYFVRDLSKIVQYTGLLGIGIAFLIPAALQWKSKKVLSQRTGDSVEGIIASNPWSMHTSRDVYCVLIGVIGLVAMGYLLAGILVPSIAFGEGGGAAA